MRKSHATKSATMDITIITSIMIITDITDIIARGLLTLQQSRFETPLLSRCETLLLSRLGTLIVFTSTMTITNIYMDMNFTMGFHTTIATTAETAPAE
ncbi:hypothetical protein AUP68_05185 [Ilyonectria robusta]